MTTLRRPLLTAVTHRRAMAATALVSGAISAIVARHRPVPEWELRATTWLNSASDWVAHGLYPFMQWGSLAGPVVAGVVVYVWRRDLVHSVAIAGAGVFTWFLAKWVKEIVRRGRPAAYLPSIHVRDGSGLGLGFISGHSAVAACLAVMVLPAIPPRSRWAPIALAGVVGAARIVHGVHLPADVVGGWSAGTLVGLGALWCADRLAHT